MKNNKWHILLVVFLSMLLLVACGEDSTSSGEEESEEKFDSVSFKFGHHLEEDHILHEYAEKFADLSSEKTDGQVEISIHSNGQLGDQKELIDGIDMGTVDMTIVDTAVLTNFYKPLSVLDLPYVFDDLNHAVNALDGKLGNSLKEDIKNETGMKVLDLAPTSYRSTALTEKSVDSPDSFSLEDFSGMKVRTLDSPIMVKTFEKFGAKPATIPTGEAYSSMQTNVVDGMESNPEFLKSINAEEVAEYMVDTRHMLVNQAILMSDDKFNELSDETKNSIEEAMEEATQWFNDNTEEADNEAKSDLEERGIEIIEVDLDEFEDAVSEFKEEYIAENDMEEYEELIEEAKGD